MKHLLTYLLLLGLTTMVVAGDVKIDADFPGGNIQVLGIDGDNVRLQRDIRDTEGDWFYWSFRVRGAEGRTLNFEFAGDVIGTCGPAVSRDDGVTWRWLGDIGFSQRKFEYAFDPDEKEVLFGMGMNHTEKDLKRFLEKHQDNPNLKLETLCQSKKGRDVELLRIPGRGKDADFKVFLSSRHHCCEMMATYTLEGIIDAVLSESDDGTWLRDHCDFFIMPFVDKDGVEDGDQGKNRKPHDHNRDYWKRIYPEVQAITEQVPVWQAGNPIFWFDMHCPWLRGGADGDKPEQGTNEDLYLVGSESEEVWKMQQRFGKILETIMKGSIPYKESFNLPYGKSWNSAANTDSGLQSNSQWGSTLPNRVFASSIEIPYANASGVVVDADSARMLGNDLAGAIRVYLETLEN
ncbi:MAG: hypothetical protein FWH27_17510 [Planctomycetaceae bacterium]|nr:hypothetical protein [Planctomycetaceae bacterium]